MSGNIAQLFSRHRATPNRVLYRHFTGAAWEDVTVDEVAQRIGRWQAAFRREGFAPGERIALCARNGVDWVAIDQAALGLGLVVVPLYVDDNPESVAWCVDNAQARLLIVESSGIAANLTSLADGEHLLPPIVVLRPDDGERSATAATFLPATGDDMVVHDLPKDALATICFTSGTSGRPKGVMLSHGNILANVEQCQATGMARPDDLFLSILPLSHMFERTGGYYLPLAIGAKVAYCRGVAQIADDLASQAPTAIFAVPRISAVRHSIPSSRARSSVSDCRCCRATA